MHANIFQERSIHVKILLCIINYLPMFVRNILINLSNSRDNKLRYNLDNEINASNNPLELHWLALKTQNYCSS